MNMCIVWLSSTQHKYFYSYKDKIPFKEIWELCIVQTHSLEIILNKVIILDIIIESWFLQYKSFT